MLDVIGIMVSGKRLEMQLSVLQLCSCLCVRVYVCVGV